MPREAGPSKQQPDQQVGRTTGARLQAGPLVPRASWSHRRRGGAAARRPPGHPTGQRLASPTSLKIETPPRGSLEAFEGFLSQGGLNRRLIAGRRWDWKSEVWGMSAAGGPKLPPGRPGACSRFCERPGAGLKFETLTDSHLDPQPRNGGFLRKVRELKKVRVPSS